jgi:hypothetical protein
MMGDPYATSAFLDSSCFSVLYPLYHNPDIMINQQSTYPTPQHHAPRPTSVAPHRIGPTLQREILSKAVGVPNALTAALVAAARGGTTGQARKAPSIKSSFISRIYSAQIPNQSFPAKHLVNALGRELKEHIIKGDDYFVDQLFPTESLPLGVNDQEMITELSKPHDGKPSIWNKEKHRFRDTPLKEGELADWLNTIGTILGKAFKREALRLWSHLACDTPPFGASPTVKRKPDLVLLDKKHYDDLQKSNSKQIDWAFIRAIAEVSRSSSISPLMIHTINAKTYLMFLCQYNRRFVVALSFTDAKDESFRLTVTDREGQVQWTVGLSAARSKEHAKLFLRILVFLMFGTPANIGLDPNIEIDHTGRCVAITLRQKRFEVVGLVYSLDSVVGRGTRVWVVTHDGVKYTLKDCWIQLERVGSEVSMLEKTKKDGKLDGRVPTLFCGGDVQIDNKDDSTVSYRSGLPNWSPRSQRIHRQLVCTPIGEPLTRYRSKQEFINAISSIITSASLCSQRVW